MRDDGRQLGPVVAAAARVIASRRMENSSRAWWIGGAALVVAGGGVTDPGGASATDSDNDRFMRALDDRWRSEHHLPAAPDPANAPASSSSLWVPARRAYSGGVW